MKRFFAGNVGMILCCVFYLLWWILAFYPKGAIKGFKSGFLLIFAAFFGITAVILLCSGIAAQDTSRMLLPGMHFLIIGVVLYLLLLLFTGFFLKRVVTTELFLIVGWMSLSAAQISALYAQGCFSSQLSWLLIAGILVLGVVSLGCYLLYYELDAWKGYIDGMIPLIIVMLTSAAFLIPVSTAKV